MATGAKGRDSGVGGPPEPAAETDRSPRATITQRIAGASALLALGFAAYHYSLGKPLRAMASGSAAVTAAVVLYLLRTRATPLSAIVVTCLYAATATLWAMTSPQLPGADFVWCMLVPPLIAYVAGRRASRWLLPSYFVVAVVMVLSPGFAHREMWHELEITMRFIGSLAIITVLAYVYEHTRARAYEQLRQEIDHRRDVERELAAANQRLEIAAAHSAELAVKARAASSAKSAFLAKMSHDLRTPLLGITGIASLVADTDLDDEQRRDIKTIIVSGEHLRDIIDDILDLSRIEAGKIELNLALMQPRKLLQEVGRIMSPIAERKSLRLDVTCDDAVTQQIVADEKRVRQVLLNLAGNAAKFTETGRVQIGAATVEAGKNSWLRFFVRDTGPGIPRGQREKIFEDFYRGDSPARFGNGGAGLGLSICRQLVGLMGGEIGIEDNAENGSIFWFTLPLAAGRRPSEPSSPGADLSQGASPHEGGVSANRR